MTDTPIRTPPPWAGLLIGGSGTLLAVLGLFVAIGGWRAKIDELDRRLTTVEQTQRTNLPIFYGMNRDVAYLAERARREDERLERERDR